MKPKTERVLALLDVNAPQKASVIANAAGCSEALVYMTARAADKENAIAMQHEDGKLTIHLDHRGGGIIYLKKSAVDLLRSIGIRQSGRYVFGSMGKSESGTPTMMVVLSPGQSR